MEGSCQRILALDSAASADCAAADMDAMLKPQHRRKLEADRGIEEESSGHCHVEHIGAKQGIDCLMWNIASYLLLRIPADAGLVGAFVEEQRMSGLVDALLAQTAERKRRTVHRQGLVPAVEAAHSKAVMWKPMVGGMPRPDGQSQHSAY